MAIIDALYAIDKRLSGQAMRGLGFKDWEVTPEEVASPEYRRILGEVYDATKVGLMLSAAADAVDVPLHFYGREREAGIVDFASSFVTAFEDYRYCKGNEYGHFDPESAARRFVQGSILGLIQNPDVTFLRRLPGFVKTLCKYTPGNTAYALGVNIERARERYHKEIKMKTIRPEWVKMKTKDQPTEEDVRAAQAYSRPNTSDEIDDLDTSYDKGFGVPYTETMERYNELAKRHPSASAEELFKMAMGIA